MAKRGRRAQNHSDFAGPDANKEAIETLSKAAAKQNAKAGHNSGVVPDEIIRRHIDLVRAAHVEWQEKRDEAATAQGVYRNRLKVAKGDGVDKDDLIEAFKVEAQTSGEYVASRRNVGRYLRLMGAPVAEPKGGQGVFDFLDAADMANAEGKPGAMDAELQGQAAYRNSEPLTNNPFDPVEKTELYNEWRRGWINAQNATAESMRQRGDAPESVAAA